MPVNPKSNMEVRRKKQLLRFKRVMGDAPECLGYYAAGDPECDGVPSCGWRGGCKSLRDWCAKLGTDVQKVRDETPHRSLVNLTFDLLQAYQPKFSHGRDRRVKAWGVFLEAMMEALPPSMIVAPMRDAAAIGDFYVQTKYKDDRPESWAIRCRRSGEKFHRDPLIVRYYIGHYRRVMPTIEFRTRARDVLKRWPRIAAGAERWIEGTVESDGVTTAKWCTAISVYPDRIPDFGRLVVAMLLSGYIKDFAGRLPRTQLEKARAKK